MTFRTKASLINFTLFAGFLGDPNIRMKSLLWVGLEITFIPFIATILCFELNSGVNDKKEYLNVLKQKKEKYFSCTNESSDFFAEYSILFCCFV